MFIRQRTGQLSDGHNAREFSRAIYVRAIGLLRFLLMLAILLGSATVVAAPARASSGGQPADRNLFASTVRVNLSYPTPTITAPFAQTETTCTGSLVSPTQVVTAAHCVKLKDSKLFSTISVTFHANEQGEYKRSGSAVTPGNFSYAGYANDIAVVTLNKAVSEPTIPLARVNEPVPGTAIVAAGYGCTSLSACDVPSPNLLQFTAQVIPDTDCAVTETDALSHFCTYSPTAEALPGDSGGPVIAYGSGGKLVGVVSQYYKDGSLHNSMTSVVAERCWLNSILNPATKRFTAAGCMNEARTSHTSTLLPNGKVLVVGGNFANEGGANGSGSERGTETFDPATNAWTQTMPLLEGRDMHAATLLNNGKVLVTGGENQTRGGPETTEIYDPISGLWSVGAPMSLKRKDHTATLLPNGNVLVVGGAVGGSDQAEIYNVNSGTWSLGGSVPGGDRGGHTASLLKNGKVLVAAGYLIGSGISLRDSLLYDPASGSWTAAGVMSASSSGHSATVLANGKVLVAGGIGSGVTLSRSELFDPATSSWTLTAGVMSVSRSHFPTVLLSNGNVLATGGLDRRINALATSEIFNAKSGKWSTIESIQPARANHTATLMKDGRVLIAGGIAAISGAGDPLAFAVIYK
jgi:V8-like Glu-specific endopeptidase